MKHKAKKGYNDVALNRYVEKDEVLEDIYPKANIELTEERKEYLVNERKLYIEDETLEETEEDNNEDETPGQTEEDNNEDETPGQTQNKNTRKNNSKNTKK